MGLDYQEVLDTLHVLLCVTDDLCDMVEQERPHADPPAEVIAGIAERILTYPHTHDEHIELVTSLGVVLDALSKMVERAQEQAAMSN